MLSNRQIPRGFHLPISGLLGLCLIGGIAPSAAATTAGLSRIGGWVYIDRNNDGHLAFANEPNPEFVIGGADISLFSKLGNVETLVSTIQSDDFGRYLFENINPGTYVLRETQSTDFVDGIDTLGILESLNAQPIPGSASPGVVTNDTFSDVVLTADVGGEFYDFGERGVTAAAASKRFLLATLPPPSSPPPPPPGGQPTAPEPTSLALALIAGCGAYAITRRSRQNKRESELMFQGG
jgi:SdrD B-like domain